MEGDCGVGAGWGGVVNSWSAFGYLAAAGLLGVSVARSRLPPASLLLAAAVALEAVGSFLAHAGSGGPALAVHDLAMAAILGYVAGWHLGRLTDRPWAGAIVGTVAASATGAVVWCWNSRAVAALMLLGIVGVIVGELVVRRRRLAPVWTGGLLWLAGVAGVAWVAGRGVMPWCQPGSALQLHALWHLLSAGVVVFWAVRSADVGTAETIARRPGRA